MTLKQRLINMPATLQRRIVVKDDAVSTFYVWLEYPFYTLFIPVPKIGTRVVFQICIIGKQYDVSNHKTLVLDLTVYGLFGQSEWAVKLILDKSGGSVIYYRLVNL